MHPTVNTVNNCTCMNTLSIIIIVFIFASSPSSGLTVATVGDPSIECYHPIQYLYLILTEFLLVLCLCSLY